ncbi:MAG: PilZ domain-containing protein [Planctomycetes bacterium]|nr:PilZ domain-containing protein [Planctomycetota bacterium]
MEWLSDSSTLQLLSDCCRARTPASILWPESGAVCSSEFHSVNGGQVRFDVVSRYCPPSRRGSSCCVVFNHQQRPHVFLASVAECPGSAHSSNLVVTTRSEVMTANRRRAFRVPVPDTSGLRVEVGTSDGLRWPAQAVNLSVTGILVEFPSDGEPGLAIGATVAVRLSLGSDALEIGAEVKQRAQRAYGLFFPQTVVGETVEPPPALAAIVRTLERYWFRHS